MKCPWSSEAKKTAKGELEAEVEMTVRQRKALEQAVREEVLKQVPPPDTQETKDVLEALKLCKKRIAENTHVEGDNVVFKLGSLNGQIVDGDKRNNLDYWMNIENSYGHWSYPKGSLGQLQTCLHALETFISQPKTNLYSIRLPSGALIRELKAWELEKV